jgi:hypothetical protein
MLKRYRVERYLGYNIAVKEKLKLTLREFQDETKLIQNYIDYLVNLQENGTHSHINISPYFIYAIYVD